MNEFRDPTQWSYHAWRDEEAGMPRLRPSLCLTAATLLLAASAGLMRGLVESMIGHPLSPGEVMQLLLVRWGLGWMGLCFLGWGVCDFLPGAQGPRLLLSWILLMPMMVPFGFLGYGTDPDTWAVAFNADWMHKTGVYSMSRPPGFPLYEGLVAVLKPWGGWPTLFSAQLLAGLAATIAWLWLPDEIATLRKRMIAFGILVHPLFLLACGTGSEAIWQTSLVCLSTLFLSRSLASETHSLGGYFLSGLALGASAGFRMTSLALVPTWLLVIVVFEQTHIRRFLGAAVVLMASLGIYCLAEIPVWMTAGGDAFQYFREDPDTRVVLYRLLRYSLPPPLLVLLAIALWRVRKDWDDFEDSEKALCVVSILNSLVLAGVFLLFPRESGNLAVAIPFLILLVGLVLPAKILCVGFPCLALWGFISFPLLPPNAAQSPQLVLNPTAGPLVEEISGRFDQMRRSQRLLLASPRIPTIYIVAHDWPILAVQRPDWVVEKGVLRNPDAPVEFRDWMDYASFKERRGSGTRFYVVGDAGKATSRRFGYDLYEEWASAWNPQ